MNEGAYEQLLTLLRERRSVRRFTAQQPDDAQVAQLLEAARWAPSASNRQPYRFLVAHDAERIEAMRQAVTKATGALQASARADRQEAVSTYLKHFDFFGGAPIVLAPIVRLGPDLLAAATGNAASQDASIPRTLLDNVSSVAAALTNLLLAAHALGLGACWMTGPLVAERELCVLLGVPRGWSLAALVPLGYPAEVPAAPPRKPVEALSRFLSAAEPKEEGRTGGPHE